MDKRTITDCIKTIYPVLEQILYDIATYRVIRAHMKTSESIIEDRDQNEFWITISNNAVKLAILDWCKIFGTTIKKNPIHYKRIEGLTLNNYEEIKTDMVRYRNKYVAHTERVSVPLPFLKQAEDVIIDFDRKVRIIYDLEGYPGLELASEGYIIRIEDLIVPWND